MVACCMLTISFITLRLSKIFCFLEKKRRKQTEVSKPKLPLFYWNKRTLGDQIKINEYHFIKLIAGTDMINCGLEFTSTLLIGAYSQK